MLSTIGYNGSYKILESNWKVTLLTRALGAGKELINDGLLNRGELLWTKNKYS
ncbi:MAG TPA: hypothetical protein VJ951_16095 [Bacteroidales bacterium]|nr:hypothetical protein [Bacteroidales bacterium]